MLYSSAFATFFRRARKGQFPRLQDRSDLWQLLVTITERKTLNQVRDQKRQKRGSGAVRGDSAFLTSSLLPMWRALTRSWARSQPPSSQRP